jgi:hypothetical protein
VRKADKMRVQVAFLAAAAAAVASAQKVTSLPGLTTMPSFTMYSGYINYTSPLLQSTHSTFYWMVESAGNPKKDPLVIWYQGGPGAAQIVRASMCRGSHAIAHVHPVTRLPAYPSCPRPHLYHTHTRRRLFRSLW